VKMKKSTDSFVEDEQRGGAPALGGVLIATVIFWVTVVLFALA